MTVKQLAMLVEEINIKAFAKWFAEQHEFFNGNDGYYRWDNGEKVNIVKEYFKAKKLCD